MRLRFSLPRLFAAVLGVAWLATTPLLQTSVHVSAADTDAAESIAASIDRMVQPLLQAGRVNALSIGVIHGDQTVTRHFGQLATDRPQSPDDLTIYEIGSITKAMTGVLLADAVLQNEVQLDQAVLSFFPDWSADDHPALQAMTLRHLATHTSGLPRMPVNWKPSNFQNPYVDYDRDLLIQELQQYQHSVLPGAPSGYSNLATGVLGELLAMKTGSTYSDLLRERLTRPAGMPDTTLEISESQFARLAPPHDEQRNAEHNWDFQALAGAGAVRSTLTDMLQFARLNLRHDESRLGQALDLAWQQHAESDGQSFAMGLGWHLARDGQTRWHNGQTGGYHSMLMIDRTRQLAVVVLANTATGAVDPVAEAIMRQIAGIQVQPPAFDPLAAEADVPGQVAENGPFVFAYFNTGAEGEGQGLQYAYSRDGYRWEAIKSPQGTFLKPEIGGKLLRDPSIVQGPDGVFHMVWTTDWWQQGIGVAHSTDLINWTPQQYLDVMKDFPGYINSWAPEISYDPATETYWIYWASTVPGAFPESEGKSERVSTPPLEGVELAHRMYVTTTRDFQTYTPTELYYNDDYNCIDAFIVQDAPRDRWVMAIKNEDLNPVAKKDIRLAFADSPAGPWSPSTQPISPDWVEGPALLKVGQWWLLYYDAYTRERYEGLRTQDFENWESITDRLQVPEGMRHGTAFPVSEAVLQQLLEQH